MLPEDRTLREMYEVARACKEWEAEYWEEAKALEIAVPEAGSVDIECIEAEEELLSYMREKKAEKVYFHLEACEGGYDLIMASSSKEKTFSWISSLSERFSLVEMIATGIVYLKDNQTNTYTPFISAKGKYCNYDKASGNILEV